jgi:hypothetical protein
LFEKPKPKPKTGFEPILKSENRFCKVTVFWKPYL